MYAAFEPIFLFAFSFLKIHLFKKFYALKKLKYS